MHSRYATPLVASLALALCSCGSSSSRDGSGNGDGRLASAHAQPSGSAAESSGSSNGDAAGGGAAPQPAAAPDAAGAGASELDADPAAEPEQPASEPDHGATEPPVLCPSCRSDAGGQTSDFGSSAPLCDMPNLPLDADLSAHFRVDELRAAVTRTFSEALTWGAIEADDVGRGNAIWGTFEDEHVDWVETWSDTVIDGEITLGDFTYSPCGRGVVAPAEVSFATRDGKLAATAHGRLWLGESRLGWPEGGSPLFVLYARADLSAAHGTLDLQADASKIQAADLLFTLEGRPDHVQGSMRARLLEYPDEGEYQNAQLIPNDRVVHVTTYERAAARFPYDERCAELARWAGSDEALPELGGATINDVVSQQLAPLFTTAQAQDAQWIGSNGATRVTMSLNADQPAGGCASMWFVELGVSAHARSEDGLIDVDLSKVTVDVRPYSTAINMVELANPTTGVAAAMGWVDGSGGQSNGWIDLAPAQSLVWPPCEAHCFEALRGVPNSP